MARVKGKSNYFSSLRCSISFTSRRQRWIAFYVFEENDERAKRASESEIKISWDLQMLLPCIASVTSSFMRENILRRIKIMIHVGLQISSSVLFHSSKSDFSSFLRSLVASCKLRGSIKNSMFNLVRKQTTKRPNKRIARCRRKRDFSLLFLLSLRRAEDIFPRDKF